MDVCSGTSASAQYWSNESGSLWDLADRTGTYSIHRCDYCDVFICGSSDIELERNMEKHLFMCINYMSGQCNQENGDDSGEGNVTNNNNGNTSNVPYGIEVVDISIAASVIQQLAVGDKYEIEYDYDEFYADYVSYPYVPLSSFLFFITRRYNAIEVTGSSHYRHPLLGIRINPYAIKKNGKYLVEYKTVYTNDGDNYEYVFEF